jgi:uncharacterized membrane protein YgdD (TMEM256/DUF423 family)
MKNLQDPLALRIASIMGILCIALGAFGAHALKLQDPQLDWFDKASRYHMFSTGLMLFLALIRQRKVMYTNLFGCVVFSGCLYAMAMGAPKFLGAIVPIGGLAMIISWLLLLLSTFQKNSDNS